MLFRVATLSVAFAGVLLSCPGGFAAGADAAGAEETSGTAGIVLDPEGNPVAGERVQIYLLSKSRMDSLDNMPHNVTQTVQPVQQQIWKETDENGRFSIGPLGIGEGMLSVNVEPYAQKIFAVTLPDPDIRVQLENNGATVRGMVRNASTGQPVPNARVGALPVKELSIELEAGKKSRFNQMGQLMRAETDASGQYTIDRLPPGTSVTLEAATKELVSISESPSENTVVLKAGETATAPELKIYPGHTLTGRVLDKQTGFPIPGAQVNIGLGGGTMLFSIASGKSMQPAISDGDGKYTLPFLKPWKGGIKELADDDKIDFMFVTASAPGYSQAKFTPTAARQFDPSSLTLHHDFELQPRKR